jgi:hypothetical protein
MPQVARFAIVPNSDDPINLDANAPPSDVHFQNISAPDIDRRSPAIIAFQVNPTGDKSVTLRIRLQNPAANTVLLTVTFTSDPQRSWHEIIPPGALAASNNELTVSVTGPGSLRISDIYFLYQANIAA